MNIIVLHENFYTGVLTVSLPHSERLVISMPGAEA